MTPSSQSSIRMRNSLQLTAPSTRAAAPGALVRWLPFLICLLFLLLSRRALADSKSCARAYEDGQRLRSAGQLMEATDKFLYCAGPQCPELMHPDCQRRLDEAEAAAPSVVIRLEPSAEVQAHLSLDGGAEQSIDGQALRLNPGSHEVRVSAPGYQPETQRFFVSEGEKLKALKVPLVEQSSRVARSPPASQSHTSSSEAGSAQTNSAQWLPWAITSGVAAAGSAGLVYWGLRARQGERDLAACTPDCTSQQVRDVKRDYLLANVSLGVGISGLAAMAIWYFVKPSAPATRTPAARGLAPKVAFGAGASVALTVPF